MRFMTLFCIQNILMLLESAALAHFLFLFNDNPDATN